MILVLAFNAEKSIRNLLSELLPFVIENPQNEILIIDDASPDKTFEMATSWVSTTNAKNIHIFKNRIQHGYGANQKVGFRYSIDHGFSFIVIHQSHFSISPEIYKTLIAPFSIDNKIDGVLGFCEGFSNDDVFTRLIASGVNFLQDKLSKTNHLDWRSPLRAYRTSALTHIAFELNANKEQFDSEVVLQLINNKSIISSVPVDMSGKLRNSASLDVGTLFSHIKATLKFWLQKFHLFYDIRFHPELVLLDKKENDHGFVYEEKFSSNSPHSAVCENQDLIRDGSSVLDLGCSTGYVANKLIQDKNCTVVGVDILPLSPSKRTSFEYHELNFESDHEQLVKILEKQPYDAILLLDVLEHLSFPELFLLRIYRAHLKKNPKVIVSTGNVAFVVVRLMLLLGQFNYGAKGILDITHKRLFSRRTFKNLLEQTGFTITKVRYFPFPFGALGFSGGIASIFEKINLVLIDIAPSLFSYQIMFETVPLERPEKTLEENLADESERILSRS